MVVDQMRCIGYPWNYVRIRHTCSRIRQWKKLQLLNFLDAEQMAENEVTIGEGAEKLR